MENQAGWRSGLKLTVKKKWEEFPSQNIRMGMSEQGNQCEKRRAGRKAPHLPPSWSNNKAFTLPGTEVLCIEYVQ